MKTLLAVLILAPVVGFCKTQELNSIEDIKLGQTKLTPAWHCSFGTDEASSKLGKVMQYESCQKNPTGKVFGTDVKKFTAGRSLKNKSKIDQINVSFNKDDFPWFYSKIEGILGKPTRSNTAKIVVREWQRSTYNVELSAAEGEDAQLMISTIK